MLPPSDQNMNENFGRRRHYNEYQLVFEPAGMQHFETLHQYEMC
jgi:hypothetical protein